MSRTNYNKNPAQNADAKNPVFVAPKFGEYKLPPEKELTNGAYEFLPSSHLEVSKHTAENVEAKKQEKISAKPSLAKIPLKKVAKLPVKKTPIKQEAPLAPEEKAHPRTEPTTLPSKPVSLSSPVTTVADPTPEIVVEATTVPKLLASPKLAVTNPVTTVPIPPQDEVAPLTNTALEVKVPHPQQGKWNVWALLSFGFAAVQFFIYVPFVFGTLAIVFGYVSLAQIRKREQKGIVFTVLGLIFGYLGSVLYALIVILLFSGILLIGDLIS